MLQGISAETTTRAFREEYVAAFVERPRPELRPMPRVYIAVDPSGGGASAYAIVSIVKDPATGFVAVRAKSLSSAPPHTHTYHKARSGTDLQFEWRHCTGSFGHSRCITDAIPTKMSGLCARWSRYNGTSTGSTRVRMSFT